ncbi:MAG TPA: putative O-glycosylation ligase, exosortase A system-associated, partial [Candidatus Saccharimonadales bacterium]|nr:putative O-glycosylation ligase, exosortase A system-associated [Candidatus Saccharimonadales bacterium]
MRDIALVAAVLAAALVGFRRPAFGMLTFAFLGFLNPQSFTWGFGRTFPLSQVVAISTILGTFLSSERKRLPNQRETWLLVLLWGMFALSSFFAFYPDEAFARLIAISKILLMIVIGMVILNSEERLHSLIRVIGYSLGFYGLKGGVFAVMSGGGFMVFGPEESFLEANNSIGLALAMNIPILLYLLKTEQNKWLRRILKAMLGFSYPAIVCTYSRGAWIGMVVVTLLSVLKSKRKFTMVASSAIVGVILVMVFPLIAPERLVGRYDQLVEYQDESSAQSRFWNWEFCKRIGMARPLTGGGFNFTSIENYQRYYPEFLERWPNTQWTCHSTWLTIFGEHGFPGAILWLSLLGCCFSSLRQIRRYGR